MTNTSNIIYIIALHATFENKLTFLDEKTEILLIHG